MDFVTTLISWGGILYAPIRWGRVCVPLPYLYPPLVNNEYPLTSLNQITHNKQCKSWRDYILQ